MTRTSPQWLLPSLGALFVAGLSACGTPSGSDAGTDAADIVTDGGVQDARVDASPDGADVRDVATDSGVVDSGSDVIDASPDVNSADAADAAIDAPADVPVDAPVDAPLDVAADVADDVAVADVPAVDVEVDASTPDVVCTGLMCGGSCVSGGTVEQIDIAPYFDEDIILNGTSGALDPSQTPIDGSNYAAITHSAGVALGSPTSVGLPDDGLFAANASHPTIQLAYRNADDGDNARRIPAGEYVTIEVPHRPYNRLQFLAFSTEGSSALTFTLHYCDGTTDTRTGTIPDWYTDGVLPANTFYLIDGMDRAGLSTPPTLDFAHDPAAFGVTVVPDPTKVVTSVDVALAAIPVNARFHLLGVTGD